DPLAAPGRSGRRREGPPGRPPSTSSTCGVSCPRRRVLGDIPLRCSKHPDVRSILLPLRRWKEAPMARLTRAQQQERTRAAVLAAARERVAGQGAAEAKGDRTAEAGALN